MAANIPGRARCAARAPTASISGRRWGAGPAWLERLTLAPRVLVAFDVDANGAGDRAADWWMRALPNTRHWRPLCGDVNAMAMAGLDVAALTQHFWSAIGRGLAPGAALERLRRSGR